MDLSARFDHSPCSVPKIAVIGDVMADEYIYAEPLGFSPESEVAPNLKVQRTFYKPGGAANVAVNLRALCCQTHLFGVIGPDPEGTMLHNHLCYGETVYDHLTIGRSCTTHKIRIMTPKGQQMLRLNREWNTAIPIDIMMQVLDQFESFKPYDLIVISDYDKGVVSAALMTQLHERLARWDKRPPILVDPKGRNFLKYGKVDLITPNEKELFNAARLNPGDSTFVAFGHAGKLEHDSNHVLVTLGSNGSVLYDKDGNSKGYFPVIAREVGDPAGCGDSAIAAVAWCLAAGWDLADACRVGNAAGAVSFSHVGVHACTRSEIVTELKRMEGEFK